MMDLTNWLSFTDSVPSVIFLSTGVPNTQINAFGRWTFIEACNEGLLIDRGRDSCIQLSWLSLEIDDVDCVNLSYFHSVSYVCSFDLAMTDSISYSFGRPVCPLHVDGLPVVEWIVEGAWIVTGSDHYICIADIGIDPDRAWIIPRHYEEDVVYDQGGVGDFGRKCQ